MTDRHGRDRYDSDGQERGGQERDRQERGRQERVDAALRTLADAGFHAAWVDRAPVFDKTTLLHALYQALQLPAWFGFNWDALHDVMHDAALRGAGTEDAPVTLLFDDLELLEREDPESARVFREIVREAAASARSGIAGVARVGDVIG